MISTVCAFKFSFNGLEKQSANLNFVDKNELKNYILRERKRIKGQVFLFHCYILLPFLNFINEFIIILFYFYKIKTFLEL